MSELADLNEFIASSREVADDAQLGGIVGSMTREMGFDHFSLYRREDGPGGQGIRITDYPEAWLCRILDRRYCVDDPTYQASRRTAVGFRRDEMGGLLALNRRQLRIMQDAERAGLGDWFAGPAHVASEATGLATFVVRTGRTLPQARVPIAQLVGTFAYEAARRLRSRGGSGDVVEPVALTPRQVDCLLLIARGKTDWEIAVILGLAEDTVGKYVEDARRRYDVSRRSQLVVRALYDGHFSLRDAVR